MPHFKPVSGAHVYRMPHFSPQSPTLYTIFHHLAIGRGRKKGLIGACLKNFKVWRPNITVDDRLERIRVAPSFDKTSSASYNLMEIGACYVRKRFG